MEVMGPLPGEHGASKCLPQGRQLNGSACLFDCCYCSGTIRLQLSHRQRYVFCIGWCEVLGYRGGNACAHLQCFLEGQQ